MSSVITVEKLSKKYIIGHLKHERDATLRDALTNGARRFASKLRHPFSAPANDPEYEEFWALKDVNFEIQQGDRVGIIGRNGAGKSTLLKVLSRITEPTLGKVTIKGRVASLLEVGTGFHPELTGRENIYLNGAILGMCKAEIRKNFDEVVAFAEVERFLDTPVKRYSSGMYVRLAFAVAAHLESEILIVDEVLAVGDAQFQEKCLGKMRDVGTTGKTIVLVSHNMVAISALCTNALLLSDGILESSGNIENAISKYLAKSRTTKGFTRSHAVRLDESGGVEITSFRFFSAEHDNVLVCGKTMFFEITYKARKPKTQIQFLIGVYDPNNTCILFLDSETVRLSSRGLPSSGKIIGKISSDFCLSPNSYTINLAAIINGELVDYIPDASELVVQEGDFFGTGKWPRGKPLVLVKQDWSVVENDE